MVIDMHNIVHMGKTKKSVPQRDQTTAAEESSCSCTQITLTSGLTHHGILHIAEQCFSLHEKPNLELGKQISSTADISNKNLLISTKD